jgi:hypothetical protein
MSAITLQHGLAHKNIERAYSIGASWPYATEFTPD